MRITKKFMRDYLRQIIKEPNERDKMKVKRYLDALPKKLYRFRECNDNNLDSLKYDYIWLTTAEKFEDHLDTTIRFGFGEQRKEILRVFYEMSPDIAVKGLTSELHKKGINVRTEFYDVDNLKTLRDRYINSNGNLDQKGLRIHLLSKGYCNNVINQFESIIARYFSEDNLNKQANRMIKRFKRKISYIRKSNYISCLCETYKNSMMWERYGDNHSGFCIEYDLSNEEFDDIKFQLSPIYYGRRDPLDLPGIFEYSFKEYCYKYENQSFIDEMDIEINLHIRSKDKTYSREKEWRYVKYNKKKQDRKQMFPFAKSIILGWNISSNNQKKLIKIASRKQLTVFKEHFDDINSVYTYKRL